jgi:hypothetical protein
MNSNEDDRPGVREVLEEIVTRAGREQQAQEQAREYQKSSVDGVETTERFRDFLRMAREGTLPDPGNVPQMHPDVGKLVGEMLVMHLPEFRNPAGRKLADPATISIPQALRVAQYLVEGRGWRHHPEEETVRWIPTPGNSAGPYDQGLHIHPDENGVWPDPDPEVFYDIADIRCEQIETGDWLARHPRDISFQAATKSEAYAGLVGRLRAKIEEAQANA